uniref:Matrix extracellular phosphoglycoprotein with ASARM motif (bone) n=1 Tax=Nannospalax galili TaxID=1026970 RepID=A0A8C6QCW1_NANGA
MMPERFLKMQAVYIGLLLFSVAWAALMLNEDYSISSKGNTHRDLTMSVYPGSTRDKGTEGGDDGLNNPHDQEEYGAALMRINMQQHIKRPVTGTELWTDKNKEKKPWNVLGTIPADVNDAKTHSKDEKNYQRYLQAENSPVKSKRTRQIRRSTHYRKHLPKIRKIPSDFEGSGFPDLPERGDNDVPPFSGDGQPSKNILGKGDFGHARESTTSHTGLSGSGKAEMSKPHTSELGSNEIPEREHGGNAIGTKDQTTQEVGAAGVSLVEGSNEITGSTNFRELPGKEGHRVDAGSQNAHQGKVEFHYPRVPSKEKTAEGGSHSSKSASYNEIPKNGKGSSRKGAQEHNRNQVTLTEKQRSSGKGKGQGLLIPSHGLDNEIRNEKSHYIPHGQNNSTPNKGMSQRRGSWHYRRPHSNRRFSPRKRGDSSESSDSGSSSESDGD